MTSIYTCVMYPPLFSIQTKTKKAMKHGISFCCIVFFFVLSIALLHSVCCSRSSSLATVALQGRNPRRLLSTYQIIQDEKSKVLEEERQSLMHQGAADKVELWASSDNDDMDESVYHLDYHGVKTHPSPTPKIPRP